MKLEQRVVLFLTGCGEGKGAGSYFSIRPSERIDPACTHDVYRFVVFFRWSEGDRAAARGKHLLGQRKQYAVQPALSEPIVKHLLERLSLHCHPISEQRTHPFCTDGFCHSRLGIQSVAIPIEPFVNAAVR